MSLECLKQGNYSAKTEANDPQKAIDPTDGFESKRPNKLLIGLLVLAILLALNAVYNISVAPKGTSVLQAIMKIPFVGFAEPAKDDPLLRKEAIISVGVVTGILHSENNPTASIGPKLVHEGDVISGAKVIKIHKDRVEFEKDGFSWTQHVMEKPE